MNESKRFTNSVKIGEISDVLERFERVVGKDESFEGFERRNATWDLS